MARDRVRILLGQGPAAETVREKLVLLKRERKLDTFSLRLPVQAFMHTKSDLAYTIQLMYLAYSSAALHLHCFCHTFSAVDVEIFDLSHVAISPYARKLINAKVLFYAPPIQI